MGSTPWTWACSCARRGIVPEDNPGPYPDGLDGPCVVQSGASPYRFNVADAASMPARPESKDPVE